MPEHVVILGASDNPSKYAYKAFQLLKRFGHSTIPVNPYLKHIDSEKVLATLSEVDKRPDTLTMYVGPKISTQLKDEILNLNPKRVIFNPGSENSLLKEALREKGIEVVEDCTLIMLQGNRF